MQLNGALKFILNSPLYDLFGKRSYAQAGEDMIVANYFPKEFKGTYLDIGAYHPKQFSNTYLFYKRGWRGVVVEPNHELAELFKSSRAGDRVIEKGIGEREEERDYFVFEEKTRNTFDGDKAKLYQKEGNKLIRIEKKPVTTLESIWPGKVDLLSVDVEGWDSLVLMALKKVKSKPKVVIAEGNKGGRVNNLMKDIGYELVGMTPYSLVFLLK